jgi:hypothetical protein
MNDTTTTVLYALSTIAQTCAALAAFVGAVGIFRLQRLNDDQAKLEAVCRAARFELTRDPSPVSMATIIEWTNRVRDTTPVEKREKTFATILLPSVEAWLAIPPRISGSRWWLIAFETWNLAVIAATLMGFALVLALASAPQLAVVLLGVIAIVTAGITLRCVTVWTKG